jgi:hypothetical protein
LDDILYLEDPERILNAINHVKEVATESNNFHFDMKEITLDMIKEFLAAHESVARKSP